MTPLAVSDIPSLEVFEAIRDALRARVIAHKAPRRVGVGDRVTLLFEDRETLRWQILEMCRVERTRDAAGVASEVAVYNELIPGARELSATMFIEITEPEKIRRELDRMLGIDDCVWLAIGARRTKAKFDARQLEADRISAVHYLRFTLSAEDVAAFGDAGTPVALRVDHPAYRESTPLSPATRASLWVDLTGDPAPLLDFARAASSAPRDRVLEEDPAPLLDFARAASSAPRDRVLEERARFRAVAPARPAAPGSLRVEARDAGAPGFAETAPEALAEAMALAQECVSEIARAGGAARIAIDASGAPLRIEIVRIA